MELKPRLLITGASGLLGGNLVRHFSSRFSVVGIYHKYRPAIPGVKLIQYDLSSIDACDLDAFEGESPDYVIHCAGEANVDICEQDPNHAERQIFGMTKSVSQLAEKHGAHLIFVSTDAVSDGANEYLREDAIPEPINEYGRAKVRTEEYLLADHDLSMVVRTRFYGINFEKNSSFTEHLLRQFGQGREVTCFTDSFSTQIYVLNLADVLEECMQKRLFGVFNIVEDNKCSRFRYAKLVAKCFGFPEALVVPGSIDDMDFVAPRPPDTSLCNAKIKAVIETRILSAEDGLAVMKRDLKRWR